VNREVGGLHDQELELVHETVRDFVQAEIAPNADAWEADADFPLELFRRAGSIGLFGMKFDPKWGGTGPNLRADVSVTEELARGGSAGVANALGAHKDLACHYLSEYGSDEQKERVLRSAIAGEKIGALAITEPQGGSDVAGTATRAERTSHGWRITGQKVFITNGDFADFLIVLARTDPKPGRRGLTLFLVERPLAGLEARRLSMLGWRPSHTCELFFDGCEVPAGAVLGEEGRGFYHVMKALEWERVVMAFGATAAARLALEKAIEYARERMIFGTPVLANQVWQHRFADCLADLEAARALALQALDSFATEGRADLPAMAKLVATRTACRISDEVVQVYGGYGYAMDYSAQRFYRDARLGPIGGGTSEVLREVIARLNHLSTPR